jgi:hypothetical protein
LYHLQLLNIIVTYLTPSKLTPSSLTHSFAYWTKSIHPRVGKPAQ